MITGQQKKRNIGIVVAFACLVLAPVSGYGQRKSLAVAQVKPNPSVQAAAEAAGTAVEMARVAEAIDGQLIAAFNGTRKFDLVARSDLGAIIEEGALSGRGLQVADVDYIVVPVIDDFQDVVETQTLRAMGITAERRRIRMGMVARIYDSTSGVLLEAPNFQLSNFDSEELAREGTRSGAFSDALLRQVAEEMGSKIAFRVVDVVFPARVVAKTGRTVTINRGDGTGIAPGQLWDVFALGEELIDPDSGISLGREEHKVGAVRVTRVTPQMSQAEVAGEDLGIERGAVLRQVESR